MPKISIVVPVYNVAAYLPECLDSLKKQTLSDLEFICVDDGSTDNSPEILQKYADKDERFRIFRQKNSGPGVARNKGIEKATGKYVGFVDPDDWCKENMFEEMYNLAEKYEADVVKCWYEHFFEDDNLQFQLPSEFLIPLPKEVTNVFCIKACEMPANYLFGEICCAVWNKIYRRDFLLKNNVSFPDFFICEDLLFSIKARLSNPLTVYYKEPLYYYRFRNSSITCSVSKNRFDIIKSLPIVKKLLEDYKVYDVQYKYFYKYCLEMFCKLYSTIPQDRRKEFELKCFEFMPKEYMTPLKNIFWQFEKKRWYEYIFSIKKKYRLGSWFNENKKSAAHVEIMFCGVKFKVKKTSDF